jgi:hypothetical protein
MKIIAPLRAELGLKTWWYVPAVHAIPGPKVVYHEPGEEAFFPSATELVVVERQKDELRRNRYARDADYVARMIAHAMEHYGPSAEILKPEPHWPKKRFVPEPTVKQGLSPEVVICPRFRTYGPAKNWESWLSLSMLLQAWGLDTFAAGAPDSSFDEVACPAAWDYVRYFDASLEAILNAKLVVATDAGLAHLAVLCGTPLLMITHGEALVAPGASTDEKGRDMDPEYWPVKLERYEEANHRGSEIRVLRHAWYDLELVAGTIKSMVEGS